MVYELSDPSRKQSTYTARAVLTFGAMQVDELLKSYAGKTDEELLRLALHIGQLTPEATLALRSELTRRRIHNPERLNAFRIEEAKRKAQETNDPGRLFIYARMGIGRTRFGKADYSCNKEARVEYFKTTVFLVFLWFPLIPTGTYRVERTRKFLSGKFRNWERVPLDWWQVFRVWGVAAVLILAVSTLVRLLVTPR